MLDIGWTELLVIGVVALIVIGPRDLPGALHTFGKYVGQLRRMARQFQDGIEDIARQEELRDLQRTVRDVTDPKTVDRYLSSDIEDAAAPVKTETAAQAPVDNTPEKNGSNELADAAPPAGTALPEPASSPETKTESPAVKAPS
jgi:sec-independent protein translocase protein TatB